MLPVRKTECLRYGRFSTPSACYFVTWCTQPRHHGLEKLEFVARFRRVLRQSESAGDLTLACANVMPDHVHVLFQLGSRLSLDRTISKLKGRAAALVGALGLVWQHNFFEHQLQRDERLEKFALYIFMNPYRAGLISFEQSWPGWMPGNLCRFEFEQHLCPGGLPWPEWLGEMREIEDRFHRGVGDE